jgi:hypothetical protein
MFSEEDAIIEIYPNPVQNQLIINMAIPASEVAIQVYDLQGKRIDLPITIYETQAEINTAGLANGFYTLKIINKKTNISEVHKFVKQK